MAGADSEDDLYALAEEDQGEEEEDADEEGYDDYDTDETGTEESGSEVGDAEENGNADDVSDAESTGMPELIPPPSATKKQL